MKLLLDTHLLLWAADGSRQLPTKAKKLISDKSNTLYFSAASIWEVAIKTGLGRPDFRRDAMELRRALIDNGYRELVITGLHAAAVANLPDIHKDPFDRMLRAQALSEGYRLVSADQLVIQYSGSIISV